MNKSELVQSIADNVDLPKSTVAKVVDAAMESIKDSLSNEEAVTLIGFGTFTVRERAARTGRNPRTGQPINIKKAKVPVFKPGKALKDSVNS